MRQFLGFVQAALEAFDSGIGFGSFDISEGEADLPTMPEKGHRWTTAEKNAAKAHKADQEKKQRDLELLKNKKPDKLVSLGTSKAKYAHSDRPKDSKIHAAQHASPAHAASAQALGYKRHVKSHQAVVHKMAATLHSKAAQAHAALGNHSKAFRHASAADAHVSRYNKTVGKDSADRKRSVSKALRGPEFKQTRQAMARSKIKRANPRVKKFLAHHGFKTEAKEPFAVRLRRYRRFYAS